MEGRLKRIVCKLSGNPLRSKAFLQKLPRLFSSRGGKAHLNSTNPTTKNRRLARACDYCGDVQVKNMEIEYLWNILLEGAPSMKKYEN